MDPKALLPCLQYPTLMEPKTLLPCSFGPFIL